MAGPALLLIVNGVHQPTKQSRRGPPPSEQEGYSRGGGEVAYRVDRPSSSIYRPTLQTIHRLLRILHIIKAIHFSALALHLAASLTPPPLHLFSLLLPDFLWVVLVGGYRGSFSCSDPHSIGKYLIESGFVRLNAAQIYMALLILNFQLLLLRNWFFI